VREILSLLGPASGGVHVDLGAALRTLVAGIEGPHLHLSVPEPLVVSPLAAHVAFRCVQEAVTNSLRHSGAGNVWIRLRSGERALELQVRDDGRGVATLREGHGLLGMQDRVAEAGGEVRIETARRRGFDVSVVLPIGNDDSPGAAPDTAPP
jgi:signal transduction histidine kinase